MKNPWLSMWLSAANSWTGGARSYWTAEMQRQQNTFAREMIDQSTRFWLDAWRLSNSEQTPKVRAR